MTRTWRDRLHTWLAGIPWHTTMWLATRRQARERRRFQQDY